MKTTETKYAVQCRIDGADVDDWFEYGSYKEEQSALAAIERAKDFDKQYGASDEYRLVRVTTTREVIKP